MPVGIRHGTTEVLVRASPMPMLRRSLFGGRQRELATRRWLVGDPVVSFRDAGCLGAQPLKIARHWRCGSNERTK
jgi:hypothetical protein